MPHMPRHYNEIEKVAKKVSEKAKYPIKNFHELAEALGGEDASVEYEGKGQKIGQAKKLLPDGFFPVESEQDLIAKVAYVEMVRRGAKEEHTPGEQREEAPHDAGEPNVPVKEGGRPGGIPGIHGRKAENAPA
jgi:hypothetical protein